MYIPIISDISILQLLLSNFGISVFFRTFLMSSLNYIGCESKNEDPVAIIPTWPLHIE